jgi:hypothetical protein
MSSTPHRLEKVSLFQIQSPLLEFAKNVKSQYGEDGIFEKIFEIIEPTHKYCVEFGAWDGQYLSNCWNLISNEDWSGLFIEGNEDKFNDLLKTHGDNENVRCVNKFVEFSGQNSLDNILKSVDAPQDFDLLSIDIDGTDYFVWESLNEFKPKVVVIEFNPTVPSDVIFVQEKNSSVNQGCSLLALILLGKEKGYELICCTFCNAIFVTSDLYSEFNIPNNFIHNMYRSPYDGRIFHGYDSYVYVVGMDRFCWVNIPLSSDDFQVLPKSIRRFGDAQRG